MFLEIMKAEYLDGYRIRLWFNNQDIKVVDLKDSLHGKIYEPLLNIDYFKQFKIKYNTIEWPNEADFAPEYLYRIGL